MPIIPCIFALMLTSTQLLANLGFDSFTDMQVAVKDAFSIHDRLQVLAPTGSGKTLAYLHPLFLELTPQHCAQALIVSPTRELALQIELVVKKSKAGFKTTCCYGGHAVKTELDQLVEAPTLLIGTPGRLADLTKRNAIDLSEVRYLILDEFDKCLELGFQEDLAFLFKHLRSLRKTVLTSATQLSEWPSFISPSGFHTLNFLETTKAENRFQFFLIEHSDKQDALTHLLSDTSISSGIIFVNQRETAEDLSVYLHRKHIVSVPFHGGMDQMNREKSLLKFRNGSVHFLVTTDLGARGLDIPDTETVVHLELPLKHEEFVHRNGRTGRMNAQGSIYILTENKDALPDYLPREVSPRKVSRSGGFRPEPEWETLFIGKGKKDKLNKVDIVGFLCQGGKLKKEEIGLIEVKDIFSFVAIKREKVKATLAIVRNEKIKGSRARIEVAE